MTVNGNSVVVRYGLVGMSVHSILVKVKVDMGMTSPLSSMAGAAFTKVAARVRAIARRVKYVILSWSLVCWGDSVNGLPWLFKYQSPLAGPYGFDRR